MARISNVTLAAIVAVMVFASAMVSNSSDIECWYACLNKCLFDGECARKCIEACPFPPVASSSDCSIKCAQDQCAQYKKDKRALKACFRACVTGCDKKE